LRRKGKRNDGAVSVVVVSDLHCGSEIAVCPPKFECESGSVHKANSVQEELYECWDKVVRDWKSPDVLVCNGDAIEGQARKDSGVPCWSNNLNDQINCAAALLRMFNARRRFIIDGTGYHVDSSGRSLEHWVGGEIGAEKMGNSYSANELLLGVHGLNLHFAHHIQIGTGWYRPTPLSRELVYALLNETSKMPTGCKADILVRSHVHFFVHLEFGRQHGIITPCWQWQTRYMAKKSAFGMVPEIGAVRIVIKPNREVKIEKKLFRLKSGRLRRYEL
jgi:hypothetical protein